jgi:5-methylcytosine-specific restriction protein A
MSRKSLLSYTDAGRIYGWEKVCFKRPRYTEDGYCEWCGKKIENKRRSSTCGKECREKFKIAIYSLYHANPGSRGGYANHIMRRDNYTCAVCGCFFGELNEFGIRLATSYGKLEIHHLKRVSDGGDDNPDNLITVCIRCHKELHKKDGSRGK